MQKAILTTILSLIMGATSFAADGSKAMQDPKMQEMMKKQKEYGTPGAFHKILADMAGNYKYTSKFWQTADGTPEVSNGTAKMAMILGDRWLEYNVKGKAMGMPFDGKGMMGYDNLKQKYETLWFDNMSTGYAHGTGTFDTAANTIMETGEFSCPMTENKSRKYRGEWKIVDKNTLVYAMHGPAMDGKGPEFKNMEMTFTKTK